jgi:uncharacterized membrane protein
VSRLSLAEPHLPLAHMSRGADAADLARLRERIDRHEHHQLAEVAAHEEGERDRELTTAVEAREAQALAAAARQLEAENRARWMRVLSLQAVAGLASFVAAEMFFSRRRAAPQEAK